ncbi:MAG: hypothetical protein JNL94_13900 [Planctomycetes bacterium]|nr:hypothetical protein [Planctomycetota bacterium]
MIDPIQALRPQSDASNARATRDARHALDALSRTANLMGPGAGAGTSTGAATSTSSRDGEPTPATRKVAQDFTSLLVGTLVREMFQSISDSENGPFGDGPGADVYKGLAEGAFAESLAKHGLDALTDRVHDVIARHAAPTSPMVEGSRPPVLHPLERTREESR